MKKMLLGEKYIKIERKTTSQMSQREMEEKFVQPEIGTHKNLIEFKENVK